ncbi:MAG: T9SS type A sorting domain-containing protein, partial [Bacteroidota bacterium]
KAHIMSKKLRLAYIFILFSFSAFGQITLTNAIFPQAGDVLYTSPDSATPGAMITPPSDQESNWDFSAFLPSFADTTLIQDASQGTVFDQFPEADIIFPLFAGEGYFTNSGDSLVLLGFFGDAGFGVPIAVTADDPQVQYAVPATFGTTFQDDFSFTEEIDPEDFPELAAILPGFPPIDSVRAIYTSHREDTVDAFGNLTTYLGTFEVLRQKRVDYINLSIQFKSFGIWVDPVVIGLDLGFGGPDTTVTYQFFADQFPEPIASVSADSADVITSIVYKVDPDLLTSVENVNLFEEQVRIYPNPFQELFTLDWQAANGIYEIRVFDAMGRIIYRKTTNLSPGIQEHIHLPEGQKGLIILQVRNEERGTVYQQKLIKQE